MRDNWNCKYTIVQMYNTSTICAYSVNLMVSDEFIWPIGQNFEN